MSVDNLIRLNQIESGELVDFVNDNGDFYPSSDPSGLATKTYVSSVSGDINSDIDSLSGALNQTGQVLDATHASIQGFPTGASGQLQYTTADGKFGATDYIFYDYSNQNLGVGSFYGGAGGNPKERLHVSGNVAVSGDLYVTGDIKQSGSSLYGYTESVSGNLYQLHTGLSGWIRPDFKVKVQNDGGGDKFWISDVGEETIHGIKYRYPSLDLLPDTPESHSF